MKKIFQFLTFVLIIIFCSSVATAIDWSPQGDVNLKNRYYIINDPAGNCSGTDIVAGKLANGSWKCVARTAGGVALNETSGDYLYSNGSIVYFNDTKNNETMDTRDNDTTYTNGTGINLVGTTFSIILSYFQGLFIELSDTFSGDVSGTYDAIVVIDDSHNHSCENITGATSNLCTIVDTTYENLSEFINDIDLINSTYGNDTYLRLDGSSPIEGNLNMSYNDIYDINKTYLESIVSSVGNSIDIKPTDDEDDYFSFKTPLDRPTIKREGGKFIYFESSNVYDVGISFRKDDTYSGTLAYAKDDSIFKMLGKASPIAIVPNSDYDNYIIFETYNNQPQISVYNGTLLTINDSLNITGNVTAEVFHGDVKIDTINGQTYNYLQDWIDTIQSAGKIYGGNMSDNGDGTVNISGGTGFIKVSNSATANTILFDWPANESVTLIDGATNYIYVDYNSADPIIKSSTSKQNNRDKFLLGKVFREGTDAHTYEAGMLIVELAKNVLGRFTSIGGEFTWASGMILSETGTKNIATTSGVGWGGLTIINIDAVDTSIADHFEEYYYNGSEWVENEQTTINDTYYNNPATGLVELTPNRYGVHWIYIDNDGHLLTVYGQGDYTLALAELSQPPSSLPGHVSDFSLLVGRIIIKKGDSSFTEVASAFDILFTASAATEHSSLTQLDYASSGHTGFASTVALDYVNATAESKHTSGTCASDEFVQNTTVSGVECKIDSDTTYSAGSGISLSTTTFSVAGNTALTQNADGLSVTADAIGDTQLEYNTGQHLTTTSTPEFATMSTGQGQYELYAMNQNVESTDAVTFASVDTGQGANELYDMDQNVLTTSDVIFNSINNTGRKIHIGNTDEDQFIYFYEDANPVGESIKWDESSDWFEFSDSMYVIGTSFVTSSLYSGSDIFTTGAGDNMWTGTTTEANALFHAGADGNILSNDINVTDNNVTDVDCIVFSSGGQICSGT